MSPVATPALIDTLIAQHSFAYRVAGMNLTDISHEESVRRPQAAGNSINWVLGHIVATRDALLSGLGEQPVLAADKRALYARGSQPVGEMGMPLDELRAAFEESQKRLNNGLKSTTEEQLNGPAPFSPGNRPDETLRSLLTNFVCHENYHVGQLGVLRRVIGKAGMIR